MHGMIQMIRTKDSYKSKDWLIQASHDYQESHSVMKFKMQISEPTRKLFSKCVVFLLLILSTSKMKLKKK